MTASGTYDDALIDKCLRDENARLKAENAELRRQRDLSIKVDVLQIKSAAECESIVRSIADAGAPTRERGYTGSECALCSACVSTTGRMDHGDDCPWLRAQKWASR